MSFLSMKNWLWNSQSLSDSNPASVALLPCCLVDFGLFSVPLRKASPTMAAFTPSRIICAAVRIPSRSKPLLMNPLKKLFNLVSRAIRC